jgi:predicted heme/steroid binding protein
VKDSDLHTALAALERRRALCSGTQAEASTTSPCASATARTNKRAALGLVLMALLAGAVFQLSSPDSAVRNLAGGDTRAAKVFGNAESGTCLAWPPDEPDKPSFVQCSSDHMFEVAKSVDMGNFAEPCQRAVSEYLGAKYDPNSKFTISVLWAGDAEAPPADRNLLCGLQLLGPGGKPVPFKGRVAELDQSKVWPPGTCLGVDEASNRPTDAMVDCAEPHAAEVAGAVSLAGRFPAAFPDESEQESFIRDECTRIADAYLPPGGLAEAGLAVDFMPLARTSWDAGSRQVSCNVTRPAGPDWTPLTGRVGRQEGDVPAPAAPPPPPPPSPSAPAPAPVEAPPPVYTEPLAPAPVAGPAEPIAPPPAETTPPPPSESTPAPPPSESPTLGPPPGPPESEIPPPAPEAPPANVLEIPGLAPITLPGPPPAPPAPPA